VSENLAAWEHTRPGAPAVQSGRPARTGRGRRGRARSERAAYLFILPAFVVYTALVIAPLGHAAWLSLFEWDGVSPAHWVGFANYRAIYTDPEVRGSFLHPLVMVIFYSFVPIVLGLTAAATLSRVSRSAFHIYRTILFLPMVIATVSVALVWQRFYELDGPLNKALELVGLGSFVRAWLGDFTYALPALSVIGTWSTLGFCLILFVAGIQNISPTLYDAAKVDGAGAVREFFAVTLPGLRHELAFAFVLTIIGALRTFDINYLLTKGGPGTSTTVPAYEVFQNAFALSQVGRAAAFGIALTVLIVVIVASILIVERKRR
jgi:raffinose/stachyose/melibiose transport system permease protein